MELTCEGGGGALALAAGWVIVAAAAAVADAATRPAGPKVRKKVDIWATAVRTKPRRQEETTDS